MSDLEYEELIAQPYRDCVFSAGFVTGHPVDTIYLRLTRDGDGPTTILLRPDEAAALAWCLTGALWSERMRLDGHTRPSSESPGPCIPEAPSPDAVIPEGVRQYIRDVPAISTVIHKGLPPVLGASLCPPGPPGRVARGGG